MNDLVSVGYTKKPHGVKGELKVLIEEEFLDDFLEAKVIFLEIKGKKVPYFIAEAREGNDLIMKFEDIDHREAALDISGKEIFLREEDLQTAEQESDDALADFRQLIGFQIEDIEWGSIAEIEDVIEYPQQILAVISYKTREMLIPLHPTFIRDILPDQKIIKMELPEGILEL